MESMDGTAEYTATRQGADLFEKVFLYMHTQGAETGIVEGYRPYDADAWGIRFRGLKIDLWSDPLEKQKPDRGLKVTLRAEGPNIETTIADVLQRFEFSKTEKTENQLD